MHPRLIVALSLALAATNCGSDDAKIDAAAPSGVRIEATGCGLSASIGSGAVVVGDRTAPDARLVLTVAHTVAGAHDITVVDASGLRHDASLALFDPNSDIALLAVPSLDVAPLALGPLEVPSNAVAIVADNNEQIQTVPVRVTRRLDVTIEDIYIRNEVHRTAFEFTGSVTGGDSGGAIVSDGAVVGMIYAKARRADDRGFALDERELADAFALFGDAAPPFAPVDSGDCTP